MGGGTQSTLASTKQQVQQMQVKAVDPSKGTKRINAVQLMPGSDSTANVSDHQGS